MALLPLFLVLYFVLRRGAPVLFTHFPSFPFLRQDMAGWSLDWFLKPTNFRKVSEGNYIDDRAPAAGRRQGGTQAFARGAMSGASKPVSGILDR